MPGITGIITKNPGEKSRQQLHSMIGCMQRETFYNSGAYINDQLGLYAGWVCHAKSFSDCMPVMNEKKDLVLIYYGENFADQEVIGRLKTRDHAFDGGNASYLIHLYEEDPDSFFRKLNGWFSGIIIDMREGKILLFNDRYGMQRVYYYETETAFFFSTEAKALLKICPELRQLDMKSLGEFISCNCVLENRSLFKNVSVLPGGSVWTFRSPGSAAKHTYFRPDEWENQPRLDNDDFYEKFKATFTKILQRYTRSTQRVGMSLTGGLDTRMIMAHAKMAPGEMPCYTFGGIYRDCFDVKVARKVAKACQQPHTVIPLNKTFLKDFSRYAERTIYLSDGNLDVSGAPEIYVNSLAREIAPVRLTGNHGSEVLRDVRFLRAKPPRENLFHAEFEPYLQEAVQTFTAASAGNALTFSVFKEAPWYHYNRLSVEQSQVTLRTPYMDSDLVALMYRAPREARANEDISLRLIKDGNAKLHAIFTDRGCGGNANALVSKGARAYYEFLFLAEYAYDYGMPPWLATIDHMFAPLHLERLFLGRHKFYHFRVWYRDALSSYVKGILLDNRSLSRPYVNRAFLEELVRDHTGGRCNYTMAITRMLTVELIQRILIEGDHA